MTFDHSALEETLENARRALLAARTPDGHWEGELSSSALSTATAVFALWLCQRDHPQCPHEQTIANGLNWLAGHQNPDGGWGDTTKSLSNISTTALCWATFATFAAESDRHLPIIEAAERWLALRAGGADPDHLIPAIIARYGNDRTFSVPILTMCALAGRLGQGREAWRQVPQLPFELAAFPQRWFKWLRLPVVSYALPALIAIGLVRHHNRPTRNPLTFAARKLARSRTLRLLQRIQPESGGFLEATPLTSFVVMSLAGTGLADNPVVTKGVEFLCRSARPDGSWPIDTNLATWVTTLSVNALAIDPDFQQVLNFDELRTIRDWLINQQYRTEHSYTLANPGAWAWTDLTGGVPDADDTPGALLALTHLGPVDEQTTMSVLPGVSWLHNVQNRDGGIPTFCRGFGKLPFDRSSADLTAHTLRAWMAWQEQYSPELWRRINVAGMRALSFLVRMQREDGAWSPLWFGNQHDSNEENLTYGTARVLLATPCNSSAKWNAAVAKAANWLLKTQNPDGGWGGAANIPSSIEETALAVEALCTVVETQREEFAALRDCCIEAVGRGVAWLIEKTNYGRCFEPSPIGFYFAKLWYFEKLYPLIFTVAALNAVKRVRGSEFRG